MVADLLIGPALFLGVLIGLYEVFLVHKDTPAVHRFKHSLHAFGFALLFCFCSMNVDFVLSIIPAIKSIPLLGSPLFLRIAIGLVAAVKIHVVTKVIPGTSTLGLKRMGETWFHSLSIGGLIVAAPYVYPLIEGALPSWVKF